MSGPLEGISVIDLTRSVAGPYATKLLADYGADVLKIEPPDGDPSRRFGPFPDDIHDPERSGLFLQLNTNKRSITLDPSTPQSAQTILQLAADADVLIEDYRPGEAAAWGWGPDALRAVNRDLVVASITPFGQSGPYRDYLGSELTLQAIGGPMHANGSREREPLKLAGHYAHYHAGATTALAVMMARFRVERGSEGDYIDISIHQCQSACRDRRTIYLTAASYNGVAPLRLARANRRMGAGVRPCIDGYVNITGAGSRLPGLLKLIGREDLLDHPDIGAPPALVPGELFDEVEGSFTAYLSETPKLQAVAEAQSIGVLAGAVLTVSDLLTDPGYRERGFWETIDHPVAGPVEHPGRPFLMSATPRPAPRPAPLLGQHNDEVRATLDANPDPTPVVGGASDAHRSLPLEGLRVADITVVWAGPHVTQLLAEWGAEVIRVEPVNVIQPATRGSENLVTKEQALELAKLGQPSLYPDFDPGPEPWNNAASFTSHARNKKSMACDIMSPEGREAFLRLIEQCDVLVENNVPSTIDKADIGWDVLREVNPNLIMLRMPAYGLDGPYSSYRSLGLHVEAMVGHTHLRGYSDGTPEELSESLASDGLSGVQGALSVTMALRHRERTGEGQLIDQPLTEGFVPTLAEFVLDMTMNGRDTPPQGNTHRWHAPHNVYPTSGDNQWIAIDVGTDEEFASLCEVVGGTPLVIDPRFATSAARLEHRDDLDVAIAALVADRDKEQLFHELQAANVVAAPLRDTVEALDDPQLNARGFFEELETPGRGPHRYPGLMFNMAQTPNHLRTPPVRLGEHNEEIYLDLLGYSRDEYDAMVESGLIGTRYPESLLKKR
ncbi:MAG TPA: CoA transferase [Dehalococcoidia bacterium]|nr:CoA transferase [Dehalococcoidia bacterium]